MSEPQTGSGNIPISIMNEKGELVEHQLVPTLQACQAISRMDGGLVTTAKKIADIDFDTIMNVVCFGLGYGGTKRPPKNFEELLFATGIASLAAPCVRFINVVTNGGRPLEAEAPQDTKNPPLPQS